MLNNSALLVVDIQNDFCKGGLFSIPESEHIIPTVNNYIKLFHSLDAPIISSQDWHPENTAHFCQFGGKWPKHCIAESWGAQFHPLLKFPDSVISIRKGMKQTDDVHSAFQGIDVHGNSLIHIISSKEVSTLAICGFATDYCIKFSTLHALQNGLRVLLLTDAIKGMDLIPSDSIRAIDEMVSMGAEPYTLAEISSL